MVLSFTEMGSRVSQTEGAPSAVITPTSSFPSMTHPPTKAPVISLIPFQGIWMRHFARLLRPQRKHVLRLLSLIVPIFSPFHCPRTTNPVLHLPTSIPTLWGIFSPFFSDDEDPPLTPIEVPVPTVDTLHPIQPTTDSSSYHD